MRRSEVLKEATQADGTTAKVQVPQVYARARAASVSSSEGALNARAGRDLTIEAGQSAYEMTYDSETSRGGFFSSRSSSQHDAVSTTTALSSTFSGDTVALRAGQDIAIKGSNVVSDQGTILVAQRNLSIESAQETRNESHFKEDKESGIFGSGGVGFTIGSRQLSVDQQYSGTTAVASTVGSTAGNVTLLAGQDYRQVGSDVLAPRGDIDISAGNDVKLKAEDEIRLLAARSFSEQHGSSQSSSASIGVSFGTDGLLLTVGASRARGKADGADNSWTNTHLSAGDTVSLESGGDTTLKGAVASGKQVVAKVGGNLSIASVQDTSQYDSKEQSLGGSISIGYGKVGGSLSASQSKVSSDYASVVEQSGIKVGDGGFQVEVKGNTDLKGAVITSTEQAVQDGKNRFATAGLTLSDIANKAEYSASSTSVNFGSSLSFAGKLTPSGTGVGIGTQSGSAASTTHSGISGIAGNQAVRSGDAETGIAKIFDADKVKQSIAAQVQITQLFGQQASQLVDSYAESQMSTLRARYTAETDPEKKKALQAEVDGLRLETEVMNVLIGAVTGNGASALTRESLSAAAEEMRKITYENSTLFKGIIDESAGGDKPFVLSNTSGDSAGGKWDLVPFKGGGTRVNLDNICGEDNSRCKTIADANGNMILDLKDGQVQWDKSGADGKTLAEYLASEAGQKAAGAAGGIQGWKGTLFGRPYMAGSWQDKLVVAFEGTHDLVGGQLLGGYDTIGNTKRDMSETERFIRDRVSEVALIPSSPFAAATLLPPEVWNAISIVIKAAK